MEEETYDEHEEDTEKDLRDYIEDCVLNTQMDINEAVHNEFAG